MVAQCENLDLYVADLSEDLDLITDSTEVQQLAESLGVEDEDFDAFFVRTDDGEYLEAYGMFGIIPDLSKRVYCVL